MNVSGRLRVYPVTDAERIVSVYFPWEQCDYSRPWKALQDDVVPLKFPITKPDGSKIYVQDLIWESRAELADAILNGKGYVYICGDAKGMAKCVEDTLQRILGEAKGGSAEVEGAAEMKLLKERSRLMLDVWS